MVSNSLWWPLMASDGLWLPLKDKMVSYGLWWPLMASDGLWWPLMAIDCHWLPLTGKMVSYSLWWPLMASDDFWWPLMITSKGFGRPQMVSNILEWPWLSSNILERPQRPQRLNHKFLLCQTSTEKIAVWFLIELGLGRWDKRATRSKKGVYDGRAKRL